ncbi:MAG: hypothetical protein R2744_11240 [Bacteroidales bacterium]
MAVVAMKTMAGGYLDRENQTRCTTAALKWALSNPNIHTSIPGMTSFDMLEEDLKVLTDITLTDDEKRDILVASNETGLFCSTCNKCLEVCTARLPVPDLMRAYMSPMDMSIMKRLITCLQNWVQGPIHAAIVSECNIVCTKNFNVRRR